MRFCQQFASGIGGPAAERGRKVEPVAVFE
jgi:hypothetical protein